jgi:hypothetical protein
MLSANLYAIEMSLENPKYGVAISFLAKDEPIAAALDQKLRESFEVFFFPRKQEDLAGTDGMETMRAPFLDDCRVMVVLYRDQWGKTRWTAIEETAVKDACFNGGWKRLFFIALDRTSALPKWLPEYHVRFNLGDFGIDQAVGAIKARVLENGGKPTALTPARKAEINRAEEDYRRAKSSMNTTEGMAQICSKVKELFHEICHQCDLVNEGARDRIRCQINLKEQEREQSCTLGGPGVGMRIYWYKPYSNLLNEAFLGIREFDQNLFVPTGFMRMRNPEVLSDIRYDPDVSRAREYGWKPQRGHKGFISSKDLASQCVIQLLELMNRDADGKVHRDSPY